MYSTLCSKQENVNTNLAQPFRGLKRQKEKMILLTNKKFCIFKESNTPDEPRKTVTRYVIRVVIEENNDGFCEIGTEHRVLNSSYSHYQINVKNCCVNSWKFFVIENVTLQTIAGKIASYHVIL